MYPFLSLYELAHYKLIMDYQDLKSVNSDIDSQNNMPKQNLSKLLTNLLHIFRLMFYKRARAI